MGFSVAPQIAPFIIADGPVSSSESLTVSCSILKGDLPIEITWAHNGIPIRRSRSDINIVATSRKNSILTIESVAASHAGEYTCSASNLAGATSQSATLAVNGNQLSAISERTFLILFVIVFYSKSLLLLTNPTDSCSSKNTDESSEEERLQYR